MDALTKAFLEWANRKGYDTAHAYNQNESRWMFLSPMTADVYEAWQAARTVPDEAVSILADVIRELENGFVRCETCGDQEDTATLDCMDDLRRIHYMLSAAPEGKK